MKKPNQATAWIGNGMLSFPANEFSRTDAALDGERELALTLDFGGNIWSGSKASAFQERCDKYDRPELQGPAQ